MPKNRFGSRRGNYSFIMGGALIALMGFAALAVDISLINMAELQAQSAADAASHAALLAYRHDTGNAASQATAASNAAQFMIDRNPVAMGTANLDAIQYGRYDRFLDVFTPGLSPSGTINAVEVDVSRESGNAVDLLLAPIFGVDTHDVDAHSITAQQERAIMMVQDWSGSMNGGAYPRPIDVSRAATWGFLKYMIDHPQDGDMFGITGYGRFGVSSDYTAGMDRFAPPWADLRIIADPGNVAYLKGQVSKICNSDVGCPDDITTEATSAVPGPGSGPIGTVIIGWTNPAIAMVQAIQELTTKTNNSYFRGMLVFSDGVFNCSVAGPCPDEVAADTAATDAANEAYDTHDIHIWTILYYANEDFDQTAMENLVRGYGFYQGSNDLTKLPAMYATVAEALPTAIVD